MTKEFDALSPLDPPGIDQTVVDAVHAHNPDTRFHHVTRMAHSPAVMGKLYEDPGEAESERQGLIYQCSSDIGVDPQTVGKVYVLGELSINEFYILFNEGTMHTHGTNDGHHGSVKQE